MVIIPLSVSFKSSFLFAGFTFELKKKPNKEQPNPFDEWHSLFNAKTEKDLNMIKAGTKNKGIIEAVKELKEISLTDRLRYEYELCARKQKETVRQSSSMHMGRDRRRVARMKGKKASKYL